MASSEENNNNNDSELGFQQRGEMSTGSMFNNKFSSGSGSLFGSGWDPVENLGGSSSNHQELLHRYQAGDFVPKLGSIRSSCLSEMVNPECGFQRVSETNDNNRRRPPDSHFNPIKNGDASGVSSLNMNERSEKKQKTERKGSDNSEDYVHVRAKRGQATNSHSLAERVRRERISERMKLLQDLVPGCNKITGKAVMLDEIINYVQSLQHQVEFLSMKLATVNPEMDIDIDHIVSKDLLNSQQLSSSQQYPQGNLPGIQTTGPAFHPILAQPVWDNHLHNLLQMGFPDVNNLGPNGNC